MDGKEGMEEIFSSFPSFPFPLSFHQLHEQANLTFYASLSRRNGIILTLTKIREETKWLK